jgi:signal transduction histidine kinase
LSRHLGFAEADLDEKFRRLLALCGALLTSPVLLTFGLSHLNKGNTFLGWFLVIAGAGIGSAIFILGRFNNAAFLAGIHLAFAGSLFVFLLATSGPHGYMGLWLFIYPLAVFFMLGLRVGILFCGIFLTAVLFLFLFQGIFPSLVPLERDFKLRFFVSFFIVSFLAGFYEAVRQKYRQGLEERQSRLEEEKKNLKAAKKAAEQASMAKSEFLANMSHELRTPLNHIIGFTDLVVNRSFGDLTARQEEFLRDVLASSHHLLSLINDALDLSKVEAGKMELELGEVRIRDLLENSLGMVKETAMKHGIRLSLNVVGDLDRLTADERKLKQILHNLLSNAVKFTPDGGKIEVGSAVCNGNGGPQSPPGRKELAVWVKDTGIGIEPHDLERIFAPFEQVESSSSRKFQGTGLGLALAKRMVDLHGGRIYAMSEGKGKGTIFEFTLPLR